MAAPTGMVTKRVGGHVGTEKGRRRIRLPDGTRSVESPWVWRGFLFMSFIALGLCLTFAVGGQAGFAAAWAVITVGWLATSMWLWRKHVRADDEAWQAQVRARRRA
jgi:hypothetical protein